MATGINLEDGVYIVDADGEGLNFMQGVYIEEEEAAAEGNPWYYYAQQ